MRHTIVLSGRRGVGTPLILASLASLAAQDSIERYPAEQGSEPLVLVDGDVEAPAVPSLLGAQVAEQQELAGARKVVITRGACNGCGRCVRACRFDAVDVSDGSYRVDALSCEGCAACVYECSAGAMRIVAVPMGRWYRSDTRCGALFHAQLAPGQDELKLVSELKQRARRWAIECGAGYVLAYEPYGGAELMESACSGASALVVVTEPGASGMQDLKRGIRLARDVGALPAAIINRYDVDLERAGKLASHCLSEGVPIAGCLPFELGSLLAAGCADACLPPDGPVGQRFGPIWQTISQLLDAP